VASSQRRQSDREYTQAGKKIVAEVAFLNLRLKIAIRCRDQKNRLERTPTKICSFQPGFRAGGQENQKQNRLAVSQNRLLRFG